MDEEKKVGDGVLTGRRGFLAGSAGLLAAAVAPSAAGAAEKKPETGKNDPAPAAKTGKLIVSAPMLQNAAETSIGVAWAVSDMANGFVDISESPDLSKARRVKCGGFRVTAMNDKVMQVRITGLKPATRYHYRIGADRIDYKNGYSMKRAGTETDPVIRSFTTLGVGSESRFCVINDTHERTPAMNMVFDKLAELKPPCVVWNGDACNVTENIEAARNVFLTPKIKRKDYAACTPYILCPGNHEQRGLGGRNLEDVFMYRQPEERSSRDWDLGRNFAVRVGDIALVGLDTGEDRPDTASVSAGLFNNAAYREAQTDWLRDVLKRDDIASAPFLVATCHIPPYSPALMTPPPKGMEISHAWRTRCFDIWGPLLDEAGCQLVIGGHTHRFAFTEKVPGHKWSQLTGGGPELCRRYDRVLKKQVQDEGRFPTVIEGKAENGKLEMTIHNVYRKTTVGRFSFAARRIVGAVLTAATLFFAGSASAKPSSVLSDRIYAAPGVECNIYFAEAFDTVRPERYAYEVRGKKGECLSECWRWTPDAKDAGTETPLVINMWDDDGLVVAATTTVYVARPPADPKKRLTLALLSASCVNCCFQDQLMNRMHQCGYTGYTPVGSHSSGTMCLEKCEVVPGRAPHDGYGGFAFGSFLNRWRMTPDEFTELQSDAERDQLKSFGVKLGKGQQWRRHLLKSPLLRLKNGKPVLDIKHWFGRINGGAAPDIIMIYLGGNGVFSQREDTIDSYLRDKEFSSARILVSELRKAAPDALIALPTRFTGCADQSAYGKGYGCSQSQVRARKNFIAYNLGLKKFVEEFGDPKVVLVPLAHSIDPVNGFPQADVPAFSGTKIKVRRGRNALHATLDGGKQLGDAAAAWLMHLLGSR